MSLIDSLIQVQLTLNALTPSQKNFGTMALMGYHTHNTDLIRTYEDLAGMVSDGFTTTEPLYLMAQSLLRANPHQPTFKVIRGTVAVGQTMTFLVTDNVVGHGVGFTLTDPSGTVTDCHHTVTSGQTTDQIATAIAAIVDPLSGIAASATGSTVSMTVGTAGNIWYPSLLVGGTWSDTTTTASPGTDLDAVLNVDDDWYCLAGEWMSSANIQALAIWTESNQRLHVASAPDTLSLTSGTGIAHTLAAAGYNRTYFQYDGTPADYAAVELGSGRMTADPGSDTWAYKNLPGCTVDTITPSQRTGLEANKGNYYVSVAGVSITLNGVASSGVFIDLYRGLDALAADIQTRVFNLLISNPKVPYTRKGIRMIAQEVKASLLSFTKSKAGDIAFLSNESGFEPVVLPPALEDANPVDKKARLLKNMNFTAYAQGAIQRVQINGTVNL